MIDAPTRAALRHDRYRSYDELTRDLEALTAARPDLATLRSIGRTHGGREIWCLEITNAATGPGLEKPGFHLDAQIHADEHATSAVALFVADRLVNDYGHDPLVTRLVDETVTYVLPRLNPDGAEISLTQPTTWCGNGRFGPGTDRIAGLIPTDLDGDGQITFMRVPDPRGEWKQSERDPRLLVQRGPGEDGGTYYRLYPEGVIRDYDGVNVEIERPRDGNLNRNFPLGWAPETEQYGAGELPLSEPESRAVAEFLLDHPNVAGMNSLHTHGGVILRPSMTKLDEEMSPRDLALFRALGRVGTDHTGYPTISIYEGFTPDKRNPRRGGLMDWTYEGMGIVAFATELWDVEREAGLAKTEHYSARRYDEEDALRLLEWVDRHWGAQGVRDWTPFDHPQLGRVEIGGIVEKWAYRNPPPAMLEEVCRGNARFVLEHAAAAPRLRVDRLDVTALGTDLYRVDAIVSNHGYLPTNLTDVAIERRTAKPVTVELETDDAELVMNDARQTLGHLAGRHERTVPWSQWHAPWTNVAGRAQWLVRATGAAPRLRVAASSPRAGTARLERGLGEA